MEIALGVVATVLQVLSFCDAYAHGDHKPKHGGIMGRGDDEISVELVMDSGTVILFVEQDDKPLPSEKLKGTLSVGGPGRPAQEAKLTPAGENRLKATGLTPAPGDRLRARIILPNGDELQSIFSFR